MLLPDLPINQESLRGFNTIKNLTDSTSNRHNILLRKVEDLSVRKVYFVTLNFEMTNLFEIYYKFDL